MNTQRSIQQIIPARATSDGAGVRILRSIGQHQNARVDPFLMLDHFSSEHADDYIAGFPDHPHRGFQTVTYMLDGHMLHQDHMGNRGDLKSGDVQWMVAGKGIIHSEMPQQKEGRMRGFQLWINLPAKEKMKPASYKDIPAENMPWHLLNENAQVKLIAGSMNINGETVRGVIEDKSMEPIMADVAIQQKSVVDIPLPINHQAFIYVYEGALTLSGKNIPPHAAVVLTEGSHLKVETENAARFLLLAGKAIKEPIAQYGPFVMNTMEEIEQALQDYRNGRLTA